MTRLTWSEMSDRVFETGLDRGVLYPRSGPAVPWNGLTSVDEGGGDAAVSYFIDGRPYLFVPQPKEFTATLNAYSYPDEFSVIMGVAKDDAVYLDSQMGQVFDLSYRTLIGNPIEGIEFGYKIHLVYNATVAAPGTTYETMANEVNPIGFSWAIQAVPVPVEGYRATAHVTIDTRFADDEKLAEIEAIIWGDEDTSPSMPDPQTVLDTLSFGDVIIITELANRTWTAEGSFRNVHMIDDDIFEIENVNAEDNGDGSYDISSTP